MQGCGNQEKNGPLFTVTCVSKLFNSGVKEKLIRKRTGHRSNAFFAYEKASEKNVSRISASLGAERRQKIRKKN